MLTNKSAYTDEGLMTSNSTLIDIMNRNPIYRGQKRYLDVATTSQGETRFLRVFMLAWAQYKEFRDKMNNASAGPSSKSETSFKRKRGVFQKDLQHMMYGFGDDCNPLPETVALMEDIVVEYVTDMVHKAQDVASKRGKLLTEDFLFLIRKDLPKLNRCTELLSMNEELKQARKAFDVDEEKLAQGD